jgi:hypothetical protein
VKNQITYETTLRIFFRTDLVDCDEHGVKIVCPDDATVSVAMFVGRPQVVDQVAGPVFQDSVETKEKQLGEHVVLKVSLKLIH